MSKNRVQIGVTLNKEVNEILEEGSVNKSKLINSLLSKWLKMKINVKEFTKKSD